MPHLRIETNIPKSKIPTDLGPKLCTVISKSLSQYVEKPVELCVATIIGDVNITFGGNTNPAAQASLVSIGAMGIEENQKHSKVIFDIIEKELGIPQNRMYLQFVNVKAEDVGYQGTTFYQILGLNKI